MAVELQTQAVDASTGRQKQAFQRDLDTYKAKAESKPVPEQPAKGPVEKGSAKPKPAKPLKDASGVKAPEAKAEAKPKKAPAKKAK